MRTIVNAICYLLPLLAVFILSVGQSIINLDFSLLDKAFWGKMCLNAISMVCFFVPFEIIFTGKEDIEVKDKEMAFKQKAEQIKSRSSFKKWLSHDEYLARVNSYIDEKLLSIGMARQVYEDKYRNNNKAVRNDKTLSWAEKRGLYLANRYVKIKPVEYYQIFTKKSTATAFNCIPINSARYSTRRHIKKAFTFVLFGIGMTAIILPTDFTKTPLQVLLDMGYRIGAGMMQVISAYMGVQADRRHYGQVLSARCQVIDEYLESKSSQIVDDNSIL